MIRQDKVKFVEEMNATFQGSPHLILASFSGMTVNQATELRRKIDEIGGIFFALAEGCIGEESATLTIDGFRDHD